MNRSSYPVSVYWLILLIVLLLSPLVSATDVRFDQLMELRRDLLAERAEFEEDLHAVSAEECHARLREWRSQNADLVKAIRELAIERSPLAREPKMISEEEWQHRIAGLPFGGTPVYGGAEGNKCFQGGAAIR